jgi:hypothetical protein
MKSRGRESAASLSVAKNSGIDHRLSPPASLTQAQKAVWVTIVNARPAEWFGPEHAGLLTQYCRHKVQSDIIAQQLEDFLPEWMADEDGLKRYDKLSGMMERETRAINALLRSMRITQQSIIRADKAVSTQSARKPWQAESD